MARFLSRLLDRVVAQSSVRLLLVQVIVFLFVCLFFDFLSDCVLGNCDLWRLNFWGSRRRELDEFSVLLFGVPLFSPYALEVQPRLTAALWLLTAASFFWSMFVLSPDGKRKLKDWLLGAGGPLVSVLLLIPLFFAFAYLSIFHWAEGGLSRYGPSSNAKISATLFPYWFGFWVAYLVAEEREGPAKESGFSEGNNKALLPAIIATAAFFWVRP